MRYRIGEHIHRDMKLSQIRPKGIRNRNPLAEGCISLNLMQGSDARKMLMIHAMRADAIRL